MAARGGGMSRKGRLTTKGKHALILALTIAACVTAMLFSLLLSVLCDGNMYLLQRMQEIFHIRPS